MCLLWKELSNDVYKAAQAEKFLLDLDAICSALINKINQNDRSGAVYSPETPETPEPSKNMSSTYVGK